MEQITKRTLEGLSILEEVKSLLLDLELLSQDLIQDIDSHGKLSEQDTEQVELLAEQWATSINEIEELLHIL